MRVLEGFCWFKARSHDKNRFFLKSFALCRHVSRKVISVSEILAVNFIVGWQLFASSVFAAFSTFPLT